MYKSEHQKTHQLLMDTAFLAGEIMLKSGAETYRVEDTMCRILKTADVEISEAFVMMTGISATLSSPDMDPITVVKRIPNRTSELNKVDAVNAVSRQFCAGELTVEEANRRLREIRGREKQYGLWLYNLGIVLVAAGFVMLLGGTLTDTLAAVADGIILALMLTLGKLLKLNDFIQDCFSSAMLAAGAVFMKVLLPFEMNMDLIIIGTLMPLVPGLAITNAIRDTLQGDYLSGGSRALEAFLKASAIAVGVGIGIAATTAVFGGVKL